MARNPFYTYEANVNGLSDQFDSLLDEHSVRSAGIAVFRARGDTLFEMTEEEADEALKFLGKTPLQRDKNLSKLNERAAATLILRARYLCIVAYRQIQLANHVAEGVVGSGYRAAAVFAARTAITTTVFPSPSKVVRANSW